MNTRTATLVASFLVLCLAQAVFISADAATIFVKASATGANNGTSWVDAFTDLQSALAVAAVGDEIWVSAGTYRPTPGNVRSATFQLKSGVAVYGGFDGSETLLSERNLTANLCVLSGDIGVAGVHTDDSYHVITGSFTNSTAILDGFRVQYGRADVYPDHTGAGMYSDSGSPTIRNVLFRDCWALQSGGGMYNTASSPILQFVIFLNNYSDANGGGMYNYRASNPVLRSVTFADNRVYGNGAGMYNYDSSPVLDVVSFQNNDCTVATPALGGGMYNETGSNPQMRDVIFAGNQAEHGGGMCNFSGSAPFLDRVSFRENHAWRGGGMYSDGSSPTLVNVLFWANTATGTNALGGGMYNRESGVLLINATFSANIADDANGGGMFNLNCNPVITNVILWGDDAVTSGDEIYNASSTPYISHSIIENSGGSGAAWNPALGTDGGGNIDADPLYVNVAVGDLHVYSTSPAVEHGDNATVPAGSATDLDGYPRIYGPIVDIGAYEVQGHPTGVEDDVSTPGAPSIRSVHPNPFNPSTVIEFELAARGPARLAVYDASGRLVRVLVDGMCDAGRHETAWNGTDDRGTAVASGVYFVRFESGDRIVSAKIVLMR